MEELKEKQISAESEASAENPSVETTSSGGESAPSGRRLAGASMSKGKKTALIAGGVAVAVLAGGYLGLCAYASGQRVLPGVTAAGVDLSGATVSVARARLEQSAAARYETLEIPLVIGEKTLTLSAKEAGTALDVDATLALAQETGKDSFLGGGANFLRGLVTTRQVEGITHVTNTDYIEQTLQAAAQAVSQPMKETAWTLEETDTDARLILKRGETGREVDVDDLRQQVMTALASASEEPIAAKVEVKSPTAPDFSALAQQLDRQPANAALDTEADEIVPHVLGLSLDEAAAQQVYEGLAEGGEGAVTLQVTAPDITTEQLRVSLFRDVLGEASSKYTGSANRTNNVLLASAACDGVILQPGEQMSYNQTTGQRTTAKGYKPAPGYGAGGKSVDMVGGGVCQPSSTLYLATLYARLKTVDRKNHMYTVGYVPDGMDATVSWPNLDFVFENNTEYPIKIEMKAEKGVLTCRILGTKTDGKYVKMSNKVLETYPFEREYKADETVERGTTKVEQTAYTGKKVECYRHIYDENGELLETELISTDVYKKRNSIILYNPLDGVEGVIDPISSENPAENTEKPAETPTESTENQEQTAEPSPSPTPTPTPSENPQPIENTGVEGNSEKEELGIPTEKEPEPTPTPTPIPSESYIDSSILGN